MLKKIRYIFTNVLKIFYPREYIRLIGIFILEILNGFCEILSTVTLPLFIFCISNPEGVKSKLSSYNLQSISTLDNKKFIVFAAVFILVIILLKNSVYILIARHKFNFISKIQKRFSRIIFNAHLKDDYINIMRVNSSEIINVVHYDSIIAINVVFGAVVNMISIAIISACIIGYLFYYNLMLASISFVVLAFFVLVILRAFKKKIEYYGIVEQKNKRSYTEIVTSAVFNIIDIILQKKQNFFVSKFEHFNQQSANAFVFKSTLNYIFRPLFEVIGLITITGICIIQLYQGYSSVEIIALLTLFGVAFLRIIPYTNEVVGYTSIINYNYPCFQKAFDDFNRLEFDRKQVVDDDKLPDDWTEIKIDDLYFKYSDDKAPALKNVSCTIKRGQYIGIAGETGSGKSTFVNCVLGLLKPQSGDVHVGGHSIYNNLSQWQGLFAYVPQRINFLDASLQENIAFGIEEQHIDKELLREAIKLAGLHDFVDGLPQKELTRIGENANWLSGGQRQRIGIARALYQKPRILVLDEATSALDNNTEAFVIDSIDEILKNCTVITIAHRHSSIVKCDKILYFEGGVLKDVGNYADLINRISDFRNSSLHEIAAK